MGFHSYRNIGFSFTDAEASCRKWREKFTGFDPEGREEFLSIRPEQGFVYTKYLECHYRLNCENGVLEKETQEDQADQLPGKEDREKWTDQLLMNEALAVYHYIGDSTGFIRQPGNWVPESALDPVSIRSNDRTNPLFNGFARAYSGWMQELDVRCKSAGGCHENSPGDTAWTFYPFPEIPVKVAFWERDEEFPTQVKVFVRENAIDYVHYEALAFMIADIFTKIDESK